MGQDRSRVHTSVSMRIQYSWHSTNAEELTQGVLQRLVKHALDCVPQKVYSAVGFHEGVS